jgi:hypothetical protein
MVLETSRAESAPARVVSMNSTAIPLAESGTFDERWAAWQARGAAHERAVRRRVAIAAPLLAVAAAILYALLIA